MIGKALLHYIKYLFRLDNPHTQTSLQEQELIKKYARTSSRAVEIGVFDGFNTAIIAQNLKKEGVLFAIDPFFKGKLGISYNKFISHSYVKRKKLSNVQWLEGLSWEMARKVPVEIDLIFVDGDHTFEGVKKDFDLFSKKLSLSGVIIFHDAKVFEDGWPEADWGPVRRINEIIIPTHEWIIIDGVDSAVVVQRKPGKD